jgi:polar amino acid transport system substrate-binding protein
MQRMTNPDDLKQLAPTGKLRGGVVVSPAASAFFAIRDGLGEVKGVTVDLVRAFAEALKLPLVLQVYENSGQVTDAVGKGDCDLAFMPQDAERAKKVDFGPAYYFISSTYLVPAGSTIQSIEAVNRPGVRIVAISNTTTARSARRTAPNASVEEVTSVDLMTEMARTGSGDAFALSHDSFAGLLPKLPGARVLSGNFQQTGIAVAVPKGRPAALKIASALLEDAKKSGLVRRALDAAGFKDAVVAPPANKRAHSLTDPPNACANGPLNVRYRGSSGHGIGVS